MSELLQKQLDFVKMLERLFKFAYFAGIAITIGDVYRDPRVFGIMGESKGYGHAKSAHKQRLAIDLNIIKDGKLVTTTEGHRQLGEYWESIGGTWGGRFSKPDANHYSVEHNGIK